jgi:hypothetical protein
MALSVKRAPERSSSSNFAPLTQILEAAEGGDDLLAHRPVLATVLDDLETGATAGGLFSEKHGAEPRNGSFVANTKSAMPIVTSSAMCDYVALHYLRKCRSQANNINDLRHPGGSQSSKFSQNTIDNL